MREYKIWDNGNKCTIINEYNDYDDFEFDSLVGDSPIGILGCNLRDYIIEWNNDHMKKASEVFEWIMGEKKIKSFNFTGKDLINGYGTDTYYDNEGNEVELDPDKEYSTEELKDLIALMYDNDCFDEASIFNIINQTKFENFIIRPFYAYIHSGISVSLGDFNDPWDSGVAGLAWYEPYEGQSMEEAEKCFQQDFKTYDRYICGYYNEYHIQNFEKINGVWKLDVYNDFWDVEESFEDAWENCGFHIENEVKNFAEEDKDLVRKEIIIGDNEVLDYFEDYLQ